MQNGYRGFWRAAVLATLWTLACRGDSVPAFVFSEFASGSGLKFAGSATVAGKVLRLTRATEETSGAAWAPDKQAVGNGFDTTFQFQLTEQDGPVRGADGFAFVLQNSSTRTAMRVTLRGITSRYARMEVSQK